MKMGRDWKTGRTAESTGMGWQEGDEQAENRATPTRGPAENKRQIQCVADTNPTEPVREREDRATRGLTPEDQGVSAQTTGLPLPLSQALPRTEGNCVSFIHLFIRDPASGIVSNR